MRFRGLAYRAHDPRWSFKPLSGEGAAVHGGRFNPKGTPALYLALDPMTAIKEANQGFARKFEPCVLCAYEVDCDDVVDLRSEALRAAAGVAAADMACAWFAEAAARRTPPSWRVAKRLIAEGAAGLIAPSYARRATPRRRQSRARGLERPLASSRRRVRSERPSAEEAAFLAVSLSRRTAPLLGQAQIPHACKDVSPMAARQFIYHMQGLTKTWPGGKKVLENINLSFYPDAKIGVLGVNGSGKSTLLRIMAGLDTEFTGEGFIAEGARVGYLPQEPHLDPDLDVRGNVMLGVKDKQAILDRYNELAMNYSDETADEMTRLQDEIEAKGLWDLDSQVEQAMDALGCPPDDADVDNALGRRAPPRRAVPAAARKARPAAARRADQPSRRRDGELARRAPARTIPARS